MHERGQEGYQMCCERVGVAGQCTLLSQLTHVPNRLEDINKHCLKEFRKHWECLENNNQQLWHCRRAERPLNQCVFDNLVSCSRPPAISSYVHSCPNFVNVTENGEDYSRHPRRRDTCTSPAEADLFTKSVKTCLNCVRHDIVNSSSANKLHIPKVSEGFRRT